MDDERKRRKHQVLNEYTSECRDWTMGLANGAVATGPLTVSCIDSEEWFRAVCGAVKSARGRRGHRGHSGMPIQLRKSRRES